MISNGQVIAIASRREPCKESWIPSPGRKDKKNQQEYACERQGVPANVEAVASSPAPASLTRRARARPDISDLGNH